MKVTALAAGTGVPAQSDSSLGRTASPERLERAKAIASGQEPVAEVPQSSGDPQVDRMKKIKMRTQQSTNRHEVNIETPDKLLQESVSNLSEVPTSDPIEQAQAPEETRPLSPQFVALAKKQRALQVKERELAQREQALQSQAPAGQEDVIAKLKANPLGVLQEAGVTYDQLTEAILANQSGVTPELQAMKAELKALKEDLNSQFVTRDQQAEQQVLGEIKREALALTAQGEQYEAIREAKAQNTVVDLIHRTWKKTGEVLDVSEAAELVENQLIEEALPFARIKKVQSRLTPAQEQQAAQIPAVPKPNTKVMRTLTNRDNASPIMDRRQRAIMAMNGTLKKG
jgi:hypothetical protein